MEPRVQHKYKVTTTATVCIGESEYKIPVEFTVREMPWDKGKTVGQLVSEQENRARVEFSWKKKHIKIEQIF